MGKQNLYIDRCLQQQPTMTGVAAPTSHRAIPSSAAEDKCRNQPIRDVPADLHALAETL